MTIQISGHEQSGLVVAWILVKRSSEHTYPGGGFSINNVSCVNAVHDSGRVPSTFQRSLTRFSCNTSRFVWVVLVTSKYFSEIGNDSSFGTWRWTQGSVWWRWMKSPSIDQKSFRASAPSCGDVGWDPSAFPRKSPQEIFTPYRMILPWSCLLDFMISSKQFCRAVCDWENVFSPILDVIISFALSLRAWTSERPIFTAPQGLHLESLLSKFSPHTVHIQAIFLVTFSHQIGGAWTGLLQKEGGIPRWSQTETQALWMNGSPHRLSQGRSPSARRSWTFRR